MAGKTDLPDNALQVDILSSQIKRSRDLGSVRSGPGAWRAERLTSIALVPLTLWFVASVISFEGTTRAELIAKLRELIALVLIPCLIVTTFWHMGQGPRVVIGNYVRYTSPVFRFYCSAATSASSPPCSASSRYCSWGSTTDRRGFDVLAKATGPLKPVIN